MRKNKQNNIKGQVIVYVALIMVVIILIVGIAIDGGIGLAVKAKLSSAVDAAAIAAGRALAEGGDFDERKANARIAAVKFFNANFPSNYLRADPTLRNPEDIVINYDSTEGIYTVTVTANATVPTFFLRIAGNRTFTASALAETTKRDLDMILVLDCSGSLAPPYSPSGTFDMVKSSAISFIDNFADGPGGDRVGLVTFASGAVLDVPINKTSTRGFDKTQVTNAINALTVGGATASEEAIRRAKEELDAVPTSIRSSLRVIVFFSDGAPNTIACNFSGGPSYPADLFSEITSGSSPPNRLYSYNMRNNLLGYYSISVLPTYDHTGAVPLASYNNIRDLGPPPYENTRCNVNRAARNMVENVADMARSQDIHVYTLGLGGALNSLEINFCSYGTSEYGANILRRLANERGVDTYNGNQPSGIYAYAADASQLDEAFNAVASYILRLTR